MNDKWIGVAESDDILDATGLSDDESGGRTAALRLHRPGCENSEPFRQTIFIAQMSLVSIHLRRPLLNGSGITFGKAHVKPWTITCACHRASTKSWFTDQNQPSVKPRSPAFSASSTRWKSASRLSFTPKTASERM